MKTPFPMLLQPGYLKGETVTIRLGSESLIEAQCPLVPKNWDLTSALATSFQRPGTLC